VFQLVMLVPSKVPGSYFLFFHEFMMTHFLICLVFGHTMFRAFQR